MVRIHVANDDDDEQSWYTQHLLYETNQQASQHTSQSTSQPTQFSQRTSYKQAQRKSIGRVYMTVYFSCYFIDNVRGVVALKSQSRTIELSMCYATKFYLVGHVPPIHDSYRICFVRCVILVAVAKQRARTCHSSGMPAAIAVTATATETNEVLARRQKHIVTDIRRQSSSSLSSYVQHIQHIFASLVCVCMCLCSNSERKRERGLVCMHGLAFALVSMIHATCVPYLCL